MEVINGTKYCVEATESTDGNGDIQLLAVVKATYDFPETNDQPLILSEEQKEIMDSDLDEGEAGLSTPYFENNWSLIKPKCDVVIKATAYPPADHQGDKFKASFNVAGCEKTVWVQGEQTWQKNSMGRLVLTPKKPLTSTPITYSRSYGGSWVANEQQDESFNSFYLENPVGTGFYEKQHKELLEGKTAPCIFADESAMSAGKPSKPVSFGPIGRHWSPRAQYAGTYDQDWVDNVFPLWPSDFDARFFQTAPEDQQIDYPTGGETVELYNMHPARSLISFQLPKNVKLPMVALLNSRTVETLDTNIDTIEIDVDQQKISLVWRAVLPLKRSLREVEMLALGSVCKRWWRSQVFGIGDCGCGGVETKEEDLVVVTNAMEAV